MARLTGDGWTQQQKLHAKHNLKGSGGGYTKGGCCFKRLVNGERKLAYRLATRFVKMQLGMAVA